MLKPIDSHTQALLDLADFIEELDPAQYNQAHFECESDKGISRCICGWLNYRLGRPACDTVGAQLYLGIGRATSSRLFGLCVRHDEPGPTNKKAAHCLRYLAITGELPKDW